MVPDPSRRTLLAVMSSLAAAVAGCSASNTDSTTPDRGTVIDYTAVTTRTPGEQSPIVAPREDTGDARSTDETSPTAEPLSHHTVESERDAAAFEFADDATNVTAVRRLLSETAYASESVFVYQTRLGECYQLKLNYVTRDADGDPDFDFCRVIRDATITCERRARDQVAAFVRLPFPGSEYSGFSVGSGGSCDPIPERYRNGSEPA